LTLAGAFARAGSTVKYSHTTKIAILRGSLTSPKIAEVDLHAIRIGKATNITLEPGDIIYVPRIPGWQVIKLVEDTIDQFVRTFAANQGTYLGTGSEQSVGYGFNGK
jgi:polysaccharide export outer membrane protein